MLETVSDLTPVAEDRAPEGEVAEIADNAQKEKLAKQTVEDPKKASELAAQELEVAKAAGTHLATVELRRAVHGIDDLHHIEQYPEI